MRVWEKAALALALGAVLGGAAAVAQVAHNAVDQQIATHLQRQFSTNKALSQVRPTVSDGMVTLTGTVPSYQAKLEAVQDTRQTSNVDGLIDKIAVGGPTVPDPQLQRQIAIKLTYDRPYRGQTFNGFTVQVHNGVVTLGGLAVDDPYRNSALTIADDTKGVKGVVDNIKVAPLSPMDAQIRLAAQRLIYGNPALSVYANDPARPIRILVDQGHVVLAGLVNSSVDKALAASLVQSIPGVFSVTNDLLLTH